MRNCFLTSVVTSFATTVAIALVLISCTDPVRLNDGPGAVVPVTAINDHDMAGVAGDSSRIGYVVHGAYRRTAPDDLGAIFLLHGGEGEWTLAHEVAHACDANGWTFAQGIRAITPEHPTPAFSKRLVVLWEIAATTDYWRTIYRRWGARAVGHPEILARVR